MPHHAAQVTIQRPDRPVVEGLLAPASRQLKHPRSRSGSAGNKDHRCDAFVLAGILRTDTRRRVALPPDTPTTVALRNAVRARSDLAEARAGLCNQPRARPPVVFPAAVALFADLDPPISPASLTRFPSADTAARQGHHRPGAWLAARLQDHPHGISDAAAHTTPAYATTLTTLPGHTAVPDTQTREQPAAHPDPAIFQLGFPPLDRHRATHATSFCSITPSTAR